MGNVFSPIWRSFAQRAGRVGRCVGLPLSRLRKYAHISTCGPYEQDGGMLWTCSEEATDGFSECGVKTLSTSMENRVVFNGQSCNVTCYYCVDVRKHDAFTTGCSKLKKDAFQKHALTADHRAALQDRSWREDMERTVARAHRSQEASAIAAMKTVYFMLKKNLTNDIFGDMKQFLVRTSG